MLTLPPQCRADVLYYSRVALKARTRSASANNLRIFDPRQQFYLTNFIPTVKLNENPLLVDVSQKNRNIIMAACATFLLTVHIFLCMCIKVNTVKLYLKAVTIIFLNENEWYHAIIRTRGLALVFKALFHEARFWEFMPNCQEPVTIEMTEYLIL